MILDYISVRNKTEREPALERLQISNQPIVYQITGFDRLNFVSDIMDAIPQNEHCRIAGVAFEADGVKATGKLTIQADTQAPISLITQQLRSVRGVVSLSGSDLR